MTIGDSECPVSRNTAAVKNSSRPAGGRNTSASPIGSPLSNHNHPTKRCMSIKGAFRKGEQLASQQAKPDASSAVVEMVFYYAENFTENDWPP